MASDQAQLELARHTIEAYTGHRMLCVLDEGRPDLRSTDEHPYLWVEVKRITSSDHRQLREQVSRLPDYESPELSKVWLVTIEIPTLEDEEWSSDSSEVIEESHRCRYRLPKDLLNELVPTLKTFEEMGIAEPRFARATVARRSFHSLTNGGVGLACTPGPRESPGININVGWGYRRTMRPDALAKRIDRFLRSDKQETRRLRRQLESVPKTDQRDAFLVLDRTEPELDSWTQWGPNDLPGYTPLLPPMIERIWVTSDEEPGRYGKAWSFDSEGGWVCHSPTD